MKCSTYFLGLVFSVISIGLEAQIDQLNRFELELSRADDYFSVIPAAEDGIFLIRKGGKSKTQESHWNIHVLDTSINIIDQFNFPVNSNLDINSHTYKDGKLFLLYSNIIGNRLAIYELDVIKKTYAKHSFKLEFGMQITNFEVVDQSTLIGGSVSGKSTIIMYNLKEDKLRLLSDIYDSNSELLDLMVKDSRIYTLSTFKQSRPYSGIKVKVYDTQGHILSDYLINNTNDYTIQDASITLNEYGSLAILGTFSQKKSNFSDGVFFTSISDKYVEPIKLYPFTELDNFFNFYNANKELKIKNRISKKSRKGKSVNTRFRMLLTEVISNEDGYTVLGEVYEQIYFRDQERESNVFQGLTQEQLITPPRIRAQSLRNFSRPKRQSITDAFKGYEYNRAVFIKLDNTGELVWDQNVRINGVASESLKQNIEPLVRGGEELQLYYTVDSRINSTQIYDGLINQNTSKNLEASGSIFSTEPNYGKIESWYGDYLYIFGIQYIKRSPADLENTKVFFLSKIICRKPEAH